MTESGIFDIKDFCLNKKNISLIFKENIFKNHKEICNKYESYNKANNLKNDVNKSVNKAVNKAVNKTDSDFFIKEKDKLFWMLYIFENDYSNYIMLGKNKYSFEMKEKGIDSNLKAKIL